MRYLLLFLVILPLKLSAENHVYINEPPENAVILQTKYNKSFFDMLPKVKIFDANSGTLIVSSTGDNDKLLIKLNKKLNNYKTAGSNSLLRETKKFSSKDGTSVKLDTRPYDLVLIQYWAEWCTWCAPHTEKMKKFVKQNNNHKFLWIQAESS